MGTTTFVITEGCWEDLRSPTTNLTNFAYLISALGHFLFKVAFLTRTLQVRFSSSQKWQTVGLQYFKVSIFMRKSI